MKTGRKIIGLIGICLLLFMLVSLFLMSQSLQNSDLFGQYYSFLLVFNALGLLVLVILILLNIKRLIRQLKNRIIGSKMTIRMVIIFSFLSVTPVLIVYYFSLDFLHRGIDSWFDLPVEQALEDSLELSRLALDVRMRELLNTTEQIATELSDLQGVIIASDIDQIRNRINARELSLFTRQGAIVISSSSDTTTLVPNIPDEIILLQLLQGNNYINLDIIKDAGLLIRTVVNMPVVIGKEPLIIQALFSISERMNQLTHNVQSAYIEYKELSYLREQLKISFIIILTFVLLFSMFSAVWAAFYSANTLAAPIKNLAEGTRAIATGNYNTRLPVPSNDELGFLVSSFNDMTNKIAQARDTAKHSQHEAESQRTYLETILLRLSSGVMVINADGRLAQTNISAAQILAMQSNEHETETIQSLLKKYPRLAPFLDCITTGIEEQYEDWREQIVIPDKTGNQILMLSGTTLKDSNGIIIGNVIVFDEITALVKGQRDAAWSEMARHLAHEIKNPLTPIQLAAERLRHKYLTTMAEAEADTLNRMTDTIIQQVDTMKEMVNRFSDYASSPEFEPRQIRIDTLLQAVLDLFSNITHSKNIVVNIAPQLPLVIGDEKKLRQVFNNLLTNAVDANAMNHHDQLTINANKIDDEWIEIRIMDQGAGFRDENANQLFEPYITTKQKGTGLGLAIVKRIIDEHNGQVWLENNSDQKGACAVIRLPIWR